MVGYIVLGVGALLIWVTVYYEDWKPIKRLSLGVAGMVMVGLARSLIY